MEINVFTIILYVILVGLVSMIGLAILINVVSLIIDFWIGD